MELIKDPAEIEKEMDKCHIITLGDIYRALRDHPEWIQELRKVLLSGDLLELPRRFEEFLEQRFIPLERKVDKIEKDVAILKEDVAILKEDVAILKEDVAILKEDVKYLKGEVGRLKGSDLERKIRDKYYAFFGKILKKCRIYAFDELLDLVDLFEERGIITSQERDAILDLDLLVSGEIRSTNKPVCLAVEVSHSLYEYDLERAKNRANILGTILEIQIIPTCVYVEGKEEILKKAEEEGFLLIKVNY